MIKRNKLLHFLNTGTALSPTYNLMNLGITNLSVSKNPSYLEEHYIADETGTKELESLAPEFSFEINADDTDAVALYLAELEWEDATMSDVHTDIVSVQAWATAVSGAYPAKKTFISASVESVGDEAGKALKYSVKAGQRGDAIFGTFNPTTKTFTATVP